MTVDLKELAKLSEEEAQNVYHQNHFERKAWRWGFESGYHKGFKAGRNERNLGDPMPKFEVCPTCEKGKMEVKNIRGELFPYKTYKNIPLEADIFAPVCSSCREVILSGYQIKEIDAVLVKTIAKIEQGDDCEHGIHIERCNERH